MSTTLNAALDWLPEGGREALADDIIHAEDDETAWEIFHDFRNAILQTCKLILTSLCWDLTLTQDMFTLVQLTRKASCISPSPHSQHRADTDKVPAPNVPDPQTRSKEWSENCMDRDNKRCVITGAIAKSDWIKQGSVEGVAWADLEVHHIIPFSLWEFNREVL